MELLINQFSERLNFGVQMDILPLVQIPHIKGYQARALYDSGLTSITQIAFTSPEDIGNFIIDLSNNFNIFFF